MNISPLHVMALLLVAVSWPTRPASGAPLESVPGRVVNVSGRCGDTGPLSVQLLGPDRSPRVDIPAGTEVGVSLPPGVYSVTVMDAAGTLVEESRTLVTGPGFRVPAGCPLVPSDGSADQAGSAGLVQVALFNSSMDCGRPEPVEFAADGVPLGRLEPGTRVMASAPMGATQIEMFVQGRRALSATLPPLADGGTITYGCTYQEASGPVDGIAVAFENTTNTCTDPVQHRFLTLWIDGAPAVGIGPGQQGGVRVKPGPHEFQVYVGQTRERVIRGAKDVREPFRIHYGCGR